MRDQILWASEQLWHSTDNVKVVLNSTILFKPLNSLKILESDCLNQRGCNATSLFLCVKVRKVTYWILLYRLQSWESLACLGAFYSLLCVAGICFYRGCWNMILIYYRKFCTELSILWFIKSLVWTMIVNVK